MAVRQTLRRFCGVVWLPGVMLAAAGVGAWPALAQVVPSGAAPGALPSTQPVPQGSPLPRVLPAQPLPVTPAVPTAPIVPQAVPEQPVRITHVAVEGVTAYPPAEIAAMIQGLVGAEVPLARVETARDAILRRYRADGYVLSAVSANLDAAGNLRFVVTEGRIAAVKLSGDIGPAGTQVLRFLRRLTEVRPITTVALERYLLLAQDVPGVTLHAVLQPSTDEPGAVNLIAQVSRRVVSGLATADNRASTFTGPIEGLGVFDLNSFTQFGERTEFSIYHAFPNSQTFGQVSEEFFVGSSGLKVKVYGGTGRTTPTGLLGDIGYEGTTTVFGLQASYPVIRARQQTLNVNASFDGLDSEITTTSTGVPTRASFDSLRVIRLGADYARSDLLLGGDRNAVNALSFRMSHGLTILGATRDSAADAPRAGERTDFIKLSVSLSRTQTLFYLTPTTNVALMGLVTGQWSPDILPPAEEFYLGGSQFTRGYYSGQITGDKAIATTVELQLNTGFNLTRFGLNENVSTQFYGFYDWGQTWQNQPQALNVHVSSAGGGVRMLVTRYTEFDFEGLARFNRFPTGSGPGVSALNGAAFYWRALARF